MRANLCARLRELDWWPQEINKRVVTTYQISCSGCQIGAGRGHSKAEAREIANGSRWMCYRKAGLEELWLCPICQKKLEEENGTE